MRKSYNIFDSIRKGDLSSVRKYVETGEITIKKKNGVNMLMEAIASKQDIIAMNLLESEIDINAQDKAGFSALHYCVWEKNIAIARLLLQKGANVNIIDEYGNNPFWYSLTLYRSILDLDLVKLLINYGADIHHKNNHNLSPLDFVKQINDDNVNKIVLPDSL